MNRFRTGLVAAVALLGAGVATSACTVTPTAASVNGDVISVASLNADLEGLTRTTAGQCLLSLDFPNALDLTGVGSGGTGTYRTDFTALVLGNQVDNLLAAQYAAVHAVHITPSERALAESTFATILDGAISAQAQQAASVGGTATCQTANGSTYTGKTLLAALPARVRDDELANQAVEQHLLAAVADLSPAAQQAYYAANPTQFVEDCVSVIQTTDQATADNAYNALKSGTSFAEVATAASANPAVQSRSGQVGCLAESSVLQQLQLTSVAVGQPVTPIQVNGTWLVYVVTSRTPVPFAQASSSIVQILTRSTANQARVQAEVLAFARGSSVEVNPQYGTWTGSSITPPPSPKPRFLLPSYASAVPATPATTPATLVPAGGATTSQG